MEAKESPIKVTRKRQYYDVAYKRNAVELAVRRYGRLELQHLTDLRTYRKPPASPPLRRFGDWLRRMWLRLLHR